MFFQATARRAARANRLSYQRADEQGLACGDSSGAESRLGSLRGASSRGDAGVRRGAVRAGEKAEKKDVPPLRYVAIRIRKPQGELFEDGSPVRHFAVLSNLWEWKATHLIEWHRQKAGTIELVHDGIKNELDGGVLPSKYFGANAAWLRLAVIAHNALAALKRPALPLELLPARPKCLRFLIFNTPGRLVHHARCLLLRLAALTEWITTYREGLRLLPLPS